MALPTVQDRHARISLDILRSIIAEYPRDFAVRLWDGSIWEPESHQETRFTLILNHPGALRKMLLPPNDLSLGEAYIFEDFDIEGNINGAFDFARHVLNAPHSWLDKLQLYRKLRQLPDARHDTSKRQEGKLRGRRIHDPDRDRTAVTYHYDVSNDFYKLWLDDTMTYTCAYFRTEQDDLRTAQVNKMDLICRKLRLMPEDRLLDIGCGWGNLIIYAAQCYGVEAVGVTLSEEQAREARQRIAQAGLEDRVQVQIVDYRDVQGEFTKIVSVGMSEHIGSVMQPVYYHKVYDLLRPGGAMMNHAIAIDNNPMTTKFQAKDTFVQNYVFPDAQLVPIDFTLNVAQDTGFEVMDVENLRLHYARTLTMWSDRLAAKQDEAIGMVGNTMYRLWQIYLKMARYGFLTRSHSLFQTLLVKPDDNYVPGIPLNREDIYHQELAEPIRQLA